MPSPDCWERLGELSAEVDMLKIQNASLQTRVRQLEGDRIRLMTVGGVLAFFLTGLGVFFSDIVRGAFLKLLN